MLLREVSFKIDSIELHVRKKSVCLGPSFNKEESWIVCRVKPYFQTLSIDEGKAVLKWSVFCLTASFIHLLISPFSLLTTHRGTPTFFGSGFGPVPSHSLCLMLLFSPCAPVCCLLSLTVASRFVCTPFWLLDNMHWSICISQHFSYKLDFSLLSWAETRRAISAIT